jgi:hypothetical protein
MGAMAAATAKECDAEAHGSRMDGRKKRWMEDTAKKEEEMMRLERANSRRESGKREQPKRC